jgi:hypothetical protein
LNRQRLALVKVAVVVLAVVVPLSVAPVALADPPVTCPPHGAECTVVVGTPGSPGGGGGGSVSDCVPDLGCLDAAGCFEKFAEPQPPNDDPVWEGHTDGAIFTVTCLQSNGPLGVSLTIVSLVWRPTAAVGPAPAVLAAQAINRIGIRGPEIGVAPSTGGSGLVGLPVWLWTAVTPTTWGPASATAAVPGLSVTATARAERIVWDMGDGHSVTCDNPGTPYRPEFGNSASPDCGYRYTRTSRDEPGGRFTITGTTTWRVDWSGGGSSGSLTTTRDTSVTVQINELQVVTS